MTVLVTGASGFIGRQVVDELVQRGHDVLAVAREPRADATSVRWIAADLLDTASPRKLMTEYRPTNLIHLAWEARPGRFWTSPDNALWADATLRLHSEFLDAGGTRAVFAGSCAEYDWSNPLLDDSCAVCNPATPYGASKAATWRTLAGRGGSTGWGRVFFLYGPGEPAGRLISDVIVSLLRGKPVDCSSGTQERDFMHVVDVARAFVALLESDVRGAVNIASGTCRPVRDILTEIGAQTERGDLIHLGARASSPEAPRLAATTSRLHREVGFEPHHTLSTGIAHTLAWWRDNLDLDTK